MASREVTITRPRGWKPRPYMVVQQAGNKLRLCLVLTRGQATTIRDEWLAGRYAQSPGVLRTVRPAPRAPGAPEPPPFLSYFEEAVA